jgi:hypothetical protein
LFTLTKEYNEFDALFYADAPKIDLTIGWKHRLSSSNLERDSDSKMNMPKSE